jgi:hypothetical protein
MLKCGEAEEVSEAVGCFCRRLEVFCRWFFGGGVGDLEEGFNGF